MAKKAKAAQPTTWIQNVPYQDSKGAWYMNGAPLGSHPATPDRAKEDYKGATIIADDGRTLDLPAGVRFRIEYK